MTEEKDCTEEYFDCDAECDINDQECKDECLTDLKHCDMHTDEGEIISELLTLTALLKDWKKRGSNNKILQKQLQNLLLELKFYMMN